jgi:general secretion pathway protein C
MDRGPLERLRGERPEALIAAANKYLPTIASAILAVAIAYELALLTFRLMPGGASVPPAPVGAPPAAATAAAAPDVERLVDAHLFGQAPADTAKPVVPATIDAPDTTLSLKLTGILFGEGGQPSRAIISGGRDEQKTYGVGDAIEIANGAALRAVYADRVILEHDGRLEALRQPKDLIASAAPPPPAEYAEETPDDLLEPEDPASNVDEDASALGEIVQVTPAFQEERLIGFRVDPGGDRAAFERLGLRTGDVVTAVNGRAMDDPEYATAVLEEIVGAPTATVVLMRDGEPMNIVINASQRPVLR